VLLLGTHGRTGVTRLILGSVASRVVATASCPVLTVRAAESQSP
jgi:nucleotide-binding universal stress UspA family protein